MVDPLLKHYFDRVEKGEISVRVRLRGSFGEVSGDMVQSAPAAPPDPKDWPIITLVDGESWVWRVPLEQVVAWAELPSKE
jgi:hypothetical protein